MFNSVYVGQSLISGAGEGLFTKIEAEANTVMAFYNGVRITHLEVCLFAFYIIQGQNVMIFLRMHCAKLSFSLNLFVFN